MVERSFNKELFTKTILYRLGYEFDYIANSTSYNVEPIIVFKKHDDNNTKYIQFNIISEAVVLSQDKKSAEYYNRETFFLSKEELYGVDEIMMILRWKHEDNKI